MLHLGYLINEIPLVKKIHSVDVAVIETEKELESIGRDVIRIHHIHNASLPVVKVLPAIEGVDATIKLRPAAKLVFVAFK